MKDSKIKKKVKTKNHKNSTKSLEIWIIDIFIIVSFYKIFIFIKKLHLKINKIKIIILNKIWFKL